jgi:zona occludens toxin
MAIELVTGLPGNCKTLFTIKNVRDWSTRENRQVFYFGIPLTDEGKDALQWIELEDATKWMECPPNSIVIIDECQRIFRNRSLGSIPGRHVTDLETHRHLGIDLVFITQHPGLIDPAIRKLTQKHRHMVRIWGMEASTVHTWDSVKENCDKPAGRTDSEKMKWKFDKKLYPLYKSAQVHTMKRSIPMRVKLLVLVPIAIALAGYAVYRLVVKKPAAKPTVTQSQLTPGAGALPTVQGKSFDPAADAREYLWKQQPRIEGQQYTAPKYDSLTVPSMVPVAAACVYQRSNNRCSCYTQQATPLAVPYNQCLDIASNGSFQEFDPNGRQDKERERTRDAVKVLDETERMPISGASGRDVGVPERRSGDGYGVNGKAGPGVRVADFDGTRTPRAAEPQATASEGARSTRRPPF